MPIHLSIIIILYSFHIRKKKQYFSFFFFMIYAKKGVKQSHFTPFCLFSSFSKAAQ